MNFFRRRRLVIAIVGAGIALIVLAAIGLFGLLRGPAKANQPERPTPTASALPEVPTDQPHPVLETSSPELFARSVAHALFDWDTRQDAGPADWAQVLVDVADADEAAALAADVREYLPGAEMWQRLAVYGTRQWLDVETVVVPAEWATALEQAEAGQIPKGASALTVTGTRHRAGTWNTDEMRTERHVSFTVFVVCPGQEPCTLLRLSKLDHPLE
jgi:cell division septation protein DedD